MKSHLGHIQCNNSFSTSAESFRFALWPKTTHDRNQYILFIIQDAPLSTHLVLSALR